MENEPDTVAAWQTARPAREATREWCEWLMSLGNGPLVLVSMSLAHDMAWTTWYLQHFCGASPFGMNGLCLASLAWGLNGCIGQPNDCVAQLHQLCNEAKSLPGSQRMLEMQTIALSKLMQHVKKNQVL